MVSDKNQYFTREEMMADEYTNPDDFNSTYTTKNNDFGKVMIGALIGGTLGALVTAFANKGTAERLNESIRRVGNTVKNAASGVNDTVRDVGEAVQSVAEGVNDTVKDVGDTVKGTVEDVNTTFRTTLNAVRTTSDNVNNTLRSTADAVQSTASDIKQSASQTVQQSPYQMAYIVPVENAGNLPGNPTNLGNPSDIPIS
jgi:gas vesicle protein